MYNHPIARKMDYTNYSDSAFSSVTAIPIFTSVHVHHTWIIPLTESPNVRNLVWDVRTLTRKEIQKLHLLQSVNRDDFFNMHRHVFCPFSMGQWRWGQLLKMIISYGKWCSEGQFFILVVTSTVTSVASEDRNGYMKFTSMWETHWNLMCVLAQCMATNTNITAGIYLERLQLFVFPQTDDAEREEDQISFQQDGAPPQLPSWSKECPKILIS